MGALAPLGMERIARIGKRPIEGNVSLVYRADPRAVARLLPTGVHPRLHRGQAVACLHYSRLDGLGRRFTAHKLGSITNHLVVRFAVERKDAHGKRVGSWVLRRETSSWFEAKWADYERAKFHIVEDDCGLELEVTRGAEEELHLRAQIEPPEPSSVFTTVGEAEAFLRGRSPGGPAEREPVEPQPREGSLAPEPLAVLELRSAFFDDEALFPSGTANLDRAYRFVSRRSEPHPSRPGVPLRSMLRGGRSSSAVPAH